MVSKRDGVVVLWPRYFDGRLTRAEGRRVPEDLAADGAPDVTAVAKAAKAAGFDATVEAEARHPARPWDATGRVLVADVDDKEALLRQVAKALAKGSS